MGLTHGIALSEAGCAKERTCCHARDQLIERMECHALGCEWIPGVWMYFRNQFFGFNNQKEGFGIIELYGFSMI